MRFHAGPSPPLLLLLLPLLLLLRSASRSAARSVQWSRGYPGPTAAWPAGRRHADDPQRAQELELIEHVLLNDRNWRPVLNQAIKLTDRNRPPYHVDNHSVVVDPEIRELLRLVEPDRTEVTPLPVLQKVAKLWWLGSYVEYAAYVTRTAFMCFTHTNIALIFQLVLRMWDKAAEAAVAAGKTAPETVTAAVAFGLPANALRDANATITLFAGKMAAVHSELTLMADMLFEDAVVEELKPTTRYISLSSAHAHLNHHIERRCVSNKPEDVFINLGFMSATGSLDDPNNPLQVLVDAFGRVIEKALKVYENLFVKALPLENWASVLDYASQVTKCENPYLQTQHETDPFEIQTNSRLREEKQPSPS